MKRLLSIALTCLFLFGLAPISLIAHEMYPNLRWHIDWGNNAGYTFVYDSNRNEYKSGNFSGTKIYYSQIYTNPAYDQGVTDYGLQLNLLVHELGHTMDLGHPTSSSTVSVMQTPVDFYDTPQDHDRSDLANYY